MFEVSPIDNGASRIGSGYPGLRRIISEESEPAGKMPDSYRCAAVGEEWMGRPNTFAGVRAEGSE